MQTWRQFWLGTPTSPSRLPRYDSLRVHVIDLGCEQVSCRRLVAGSRTHLTSATSPRVSGGLWRGAVGSRALYAANAPDFVTTDEVELDGPGFVLKWGLQKDHIDIELTYAGAAWLVAAFRIALYPGKFLCLCACVCRVGFGVSSVPSLMLPSLVGIGKPALSVADQFEIQGRSASSIVSVSMVYTRVCLFV